MKRDARQYLYDVLDACRAIEQHVAGCKLEDYENNRTIRSAVERELFVIGEALMAIRRVEPDLLDRMTDARGIIGLRNQLAHAYFGIRDEEVWGIVTKHLAVLIDEVERLM